MRPACGLSKSEEDELLLDDEEMTEALRLSAISAAVQEVGDVVTDADNDTDDAENVEEVSSTSTEDIEGSRGKKSWNNLSQMLCIS